MNYRRPLLLCGSDHHRVGGWRLRIVRNADRAGHAGPAAETSGAAAAGRLWDSMPRDRRGQSAGAESAASAASARAASTGAEDRRCGNRGGQGRRDHATDDRWLSERHSVLRLRAGRRLHGHHVAGIRHHHRAASRRKAHHRRGG